jgi:hypothetical protein
MRQRFMAYGLINFRILVSQHEMTVHGMKRISN